MLVNSVIAKTEDEASAHRCDGHESLRLLSAEKQSTKLLDHRQALALWISLRAPIQRVCWKT